MQFNAQVLNPVFLYKPCCLLVTVYCILPILFSKVTTSRDLYSLIYPTKPVLCINWLPQADVDMQPEFLTGFRGAAKPLGWASPTS